MDTMEAIFTRRSVRSYTEQPISDADLHKILEAGMSGPSCVNAKDWSFLVVRDKERLAKMADANGRPAEPLRNAAVGILVCGDLNRAFRDAKDYWVIDGAIAAQNMILCAQALGIGSVWLGTWPQMERVERQSALFGLPEHIVPHSLIAFGYPADKPAERKPFYDASCVHMEQW
jgi:nitroreductase